MASPLTPATATRSPYAYRPGDRRSGTPLPWPAPTRALPPTPTPYRRRTRYAHRVQIPTRVALSEFQARDPRPPAAGRSEERRVGKEVDITCRSRCCTDLKNKKQNKKK